MSLKIFADGFAVRCGEGLRPSQTIAFAAGLRPSPFDAIKINQQGLIL